MDQIYWLAFSLITALYSMVLSIILMKQSSKFKLMKIKYDSIYPTYLIKLDQERRTSLKIRHLEGMLGILVGDVVSGDMEIGGNGEEYIPKANTLEEVRDYVRSEF